MSHWGPFVANLRTRGLRLPPLRILFIHSSPPCPRHITAEEIASQLHQHTRAINIATIYRTLDLLWQEGFACRSDLSEGKTVYAAMEHGPHIHLVCRKCSKVIDADSEPLNLLNNELMKQYGFDPDLDHFSIFGICSNCQDK